MSTLRTNYRPSIDTQEELRIAANGESMSANASPYLVSSQSESLGSDDLSIVLIGPNERNAGVHLA